MQPPIDYVATITIGFDDINQTDTISVSPDPIQTEPDKHIVFVVRNNGLNKHKVSIDRDKMEKTKGPEDAPKTPIRFSLHHSDDVEPGDVGAFVLHVKDKDDFKKGNSYLYKYTIEASGLPPMDPDIGINN
jgi:uncharacterized cupredoxin-like copper-binding protein